MDKQKKYRYSETFLSIQGEGTYTGVPTVWYRAFLCNLQCNGFSQDNPRDPSTWKLPYKELDVSKYKSMEELPVFDLGCDSSYSWAQKFKHLAHFKTAQEISEEIRSYLPEGRFQHPISKQHYHMAFTGGEPMLKSNQEAILDIMNVFRNQIDYPRYVTFETNGTQKPTNEFKNFFTNNGMFSGELFWSVSPKLYTSGEKWKKTIKPEVLNEYRLISNTGQLKYVVDGTSDCWEEVEKATDLFRQHHISWPVWIMPVGALDTQQSDIQKQITEQALEKGYNVAIRTHCFVFGNKIGT